MKEHNLKIAPQHFDAVVSGAKKAEFRFNDRQFSTGDTLHLHEYSQPSRGGFSGQSITVRITHVTDLEEWAPGYVMLSIEGDAQEEAKL